LEPPDLGNEDGVMGNEGAARKPTTRRYSPEEKAEAVQMVRQLRRELGTTHGTIQRVAGQLGCGVESLRTWVKQAEIDDGEAPGVTTAEAKRIRSLSRRSASCGANEILKRASAFLPAVLDRPLK
jgi:transposase